MLTVITITTIAAAYLLLKKGLFPSFDLLNRCVLVVCITAISALCGSLVATVGGKAMQSVSVKSLAPVELAAMRSSSNTSGTFLLGSGSFGTSKGFSFYFKNQDDTLSPGEITASTKVHITEDASLTDRGYWTTTVSEASIPTDSWLNYWVFNTPMQSIIRYDFRVPPGTVSLAFKVD